MDFHKIFISIYFIANFIKLALHSCMFKNTTFHEWFFYKIFISIYFIANFIRLALHPCMFKNTTFHEWAFSEDIHFISKYIVLMAALLVLGQPTQPRQLRAETQTTGRLVQQRLQWGKVLHAISQVVSQVKKQNWKEMDGWRQ